MKYKNWASYRVIELAEKCGGPSINSTVDYLKSKSYRLSAYIYGYGKYSYRNKP